VGAGIGSIARHYLPLCKRPVTLVELDSNLIKILKRDFSNEGNVVEIVEKDALVVLKERNFDILFSNLPFFLTEDILEILSMKVKDWKRISSSSSYTSTTNHQVETDNKNTNHDNNRPFQKAIISVHNDDNYLSAVHHHHNVNDDDKYPDLIISTLCILDHNDFIPRQPFKSKVIVVLPKLSDS